MPSSQTQARTPADPVSMRPDLGPKDGFPRSELALIIRDLTRRVGADAGLLTIAGPDGWQIGISSGSGPSSDAGSDPSSGCSSGSGSSGSGSSSGSSGSGSSSSGLGSSGPGSGSSGAGSPSSGSGSGSGPGSFAPPVESSSFVGWVIRTGSSCAGVIAPDDTSLGAAVDHAGLRYAVGAAVRPPGQAPGALCIGFAVSPPRNRRPLTLWTVERYAGLAALCLIGPGMLHELLTGARAPAQPRSSPANQD